MAIYEYKCLQCEEVFCVSHSLSEAKTLCSEVTDCNEDSEIAKNIGDFHVEDGSVKKQQIKSEESLNNSIEDLKNNKPDLDYNINIDKLGK